MTSIVFTAESKLDENVRTSLDITFNEPKGAYLIGHVSKNKNEEKDMMYIVMPKIRSLMIGVQNIIGGNIVCLDCDSKKLEKGYVEHGFTTLGKSPDVVGNGFKRMFSMVSAKDD